MSSSQKKLEKLPGSNKLAMLGAHSIGPADPNEEIQISVILRPSKTSKASNIANEIGTRVPKERKHLTRKEFVATHGASQEDIEKVQKFAEENGLRINEVGPARRVMKLRGSLESISKAFNVKVEHYSHPRGIYRHRVGDIYVPENILKIVNSVHGIDNRPLVRPRFHRQSRPRIITPTIATAYNFPAGVDGSGQCIAILEFGGGYTEQDLDTYFNSLGIARPNVTSVSIDGGLNSPGDPADGEVELDIEVAGAVAPGANIAVYFAPNTDQGFIDATTSAMHDAQTNPSIISISWGAAEDRWSGQTRESMDLAFQDAAALGVTILAASGDDGSSDGMSDGHEHVDFPASDPFVIACGGTRLDLSGGSIHSEKCWTGSGGGVSVKFGLPDYQKAVDVPKSPVSNKPGRGVPDVSGDADPDTGYEVVVDGKWTTVGGTSAVAPLYAGLIALINQKIGINVGFVNPLLYLYTNAFNDITSGSNDSVGRGNYSTRVGWDACTGLGSINGKSLLGYLQDGK
jgi:kumamolisin